MRTHGKSDYYLYLFCKEVYSVAHAGFSVFLAGGMELDQGWPHKEVAASRSGGGETGQRGFKNLKENQGKYNM